MFVESAKSLFKTLLVTMLSISSILFFSSITLVGTGNATDDFYDVVVLIVG